MPATFVQIGKPTHHTRAERWECDFNDHWNTRFFVRSFQLAAEAVVTPPGAISPGARIAPVRHMRFHREVRVSDALTVRSAVIRGGDMNGAIAHLMFRLDDLVATAIDLPAGDAPDLPEVAAADIFMALPRSLDPAGYAGWPAPEMGPNAVTMGPIRPAELDHTGALTVEEVIRRVAVTSHDHMSRAGLTPEWTHRTGINRMVVEFRLELGVTPPAGTVLYGETRLASAKGKTFCTVHRILTGAGEMVASNEQFLLAVDLRTRRAVEVPDFLLAVVDQ